jgi:hypothetical protein
MRRLLPLFVREGEVARVVLPRLDPLSPRTARSSEGRVVRRPVAPVVPVVRPGVACLSVERRCKDVPRPLMARSSPVRLRRPVALCGVRRAPRSIARPSSTVRPPRPREAVARSPRIEARRRSTSGNVVRPRASRETGRIAAARFPRACRTAESRSSAERESAPGPVRGGRVTTAAPLR